MLAMVTKRKAPAAPTPNAKRVTRSSSAATATAAAVVEAIRPPAHAADKAPALDKKISTTGIPNTSKKIVAFLRGVNVGGRVHSMKSIADALGETGLTNVETFLASGNIVFDAPDEASGLAVEHRVEAALEDLFGDHIPVLVRSMDEVAQLGDRIVKSATAVNVVLVKDKLTQEQRGILQALSTDADELELLDREFVWYSTTKLSESPLFKVAFDKKLGVPVTVRTVNTLRRIAKKFG
ncbi:hypothetical protein PF005_g1141 [Phytophthora fragariae]|uniref:DUF1697 domain-containing protein n=2 Tax=Phytophthora fragariae TaxID=53985 RepID=A0A6A3ZGC4_9STRA|nr:hypothetical protein PF006_g2053 [Phytophthora fragariae]KAE9236270.1 hypothetical protein PF005_g1141 [Phytophthora fragariae]KAE9252630.1 hypothetical protein PF004_g1889 [Phytophthora fragariae]KAE9329358.1 hypothetical protein PF001_g952 [Phytophthora fragariae]KAE9359179.1 hypothetical protein PF008_g2349 [Phytophthora fragariae]